MSVITKPKKILGLAIAFGIIFISSTNFSYAQSHKPLLSELPRFTRESNDTTQTKSKTTIAQALERDGANIIIDSDTGVPDGAILLTVILKHDQSKTVDRIMEELDRSGYWQAFPPEDIAVVSWYVVMGLGHVVTLAVPPEKLRAVNLAIERTAWGAYRTEIYPTYDFSEAAQRLRTEEQ